MYKRNDQMRIEDFVFPYGKLDPENEWVRLAALVPWETAEERYAAQFENNGHPAHPVRVALGALIIKQRLSIPRRIVSLSQPFVRPIVRGKARARTEFGAKLHISLVDGYARIERLSFEPYNEARDFFHIVERYREQYGRYPKRILADKLYRNRDTLAFCKKNGSRLTGSALGRPPRDKDLSRQAKQEEYQDICDRNIVEGAFGTGKTAYGLGRIAAHLEVTSCCVIGVALLVMNLTKRLRSLWFRFVFACFLAWPPMPMAC